MRSRHLDFFLRLTERAEPELKGPDQKAWLNRLEVEHDNLRAALAWSMRAEGNAESALRLAGALGRFWDLRSYWTEGREVLGQALARTAEVSTALRAKALQSAGTLALQQGDYEKANRQLQASLDLSRKEGDQRGMAYSLNGLGNVALRQGDYAAARHFYEESLTILRELGNKHGIALSLNNLGIMAYEQGDYTGAQRFYEESLAILRELGNKYGIAASLNNLGNVASSQGDYAAAQRFLEESLAIRREIGDKLGIAYGLEGVAKVAYGQGKAERAARLFGAAEALREAIGAPLSPDDRAEYNRIVAAVRAQLGEEVFAKSWAEGRAMTLEQAIEYALKD